MSVTSHYVKSKLDKINSAMDEKEFLLSDSYRNFLQRVVRGVSGNYDLKVIFGQGVCTDGKRIEVNPVHPYIMTLDGVAQKTLHILGQIAHETFHILYTDFKVLEEIDKKYGVRNKMFRAFQVKDLLNIVEDSAIELIGINYYTGTFRQGIIASNEHAFNQMPSLDELALKGVPRLVIFKQACAMYAIMGKLKGKITDKEIYTAFQLAIPILDRGRLENNTRGRLKAAEQLYKLAMPFIKEAEQKAQEDAVNKNYQYPKNTEISSGGPGSQPMQAPPTPNDFQKKNRERTKQEFQQQKQSQEQKGQQQTQQNQQSQQEGSDENSVANDQKAMQQGDNQSSSGQKANNSQSPTEQQDDADDENNPANSRNVGKEKTSESETANSQKQGEDSETNQEENQTSQDGESKNKTESEKESKAERAADAEAENEDENENKAEDEKAEALEELKEQLKKVKEDAAKEIYDKEEQKKRDAAIREFAKEVRYSDLHAGIDVKPVRNFSIDDYDIWIYKSDFENIKGLTRNLTKKLADLIKYNEEAKLSGLYDGKVNANHLYRVDKRVFFKRKAKSEEADLAVAVLVDQSGSMRGERIYNAKLACMMVTEVCQAIGIPIAVIGHYAAYQEPLVKHFHYVDFDSRDPREKYKLAKMQAHDNTREGISLKYAGEYLLRRPEEDKLLISISDGDPYHNYDHSRYYGEIAKKDTGRVAKYLEGQGIKIFGVAIGDGKSRIKEIYTKNYVDIPKIKLLPTRLISLITRNIFK